MQKLSTKILLLILIVASGFLFSDGLGAHVSRSLKALWDLGHVVYFALFSFILLKYSFFHKKQFWQQCLWLILIVFVVGTLIEVIQYGVDREPDWRDVARDVLGGIIGLAFLNRQKLLFNSFVGIVTMISLLPLSKALFDEYQSIQQFPILADFSAWFEIERWEGDAVFHLAKHPDKDRKVLKITFDHKQYSGVGLRYFVSDWSQFKKLNIKIFNPEETKIMVKLRIHDLQHEESFRYTDRFNHQLVIKSGWNEFSITMKSIQRAAKNREIDLKQIVGLKLFTIQLAHPRSIYLSTMTLTR